MDVTLASSYRDVAQMRRLKNYVVVGFPDKWIPEAGVIFLHRISGPSMALDPTETSCFCCEKQHQPQVSPDTE